MYNNAYNVKESESKACTHVIQKAPIQILTYLLLANCNIAHAPLQCVLQPHSKIKKCTTIL